MQAVIFTGIQAAGKSTFYKQQFFRTHIRINLDMLRTRHREQIFLSACIDAKQPFVIDNTNPTRQDRAVYIEAAKAAGFEIVGYYFQSKARDAIERNAHRPTEEQVPDVGIWGCAGRLEIPSTDEGFDRLYYVWINSSSEFVIEGWQDEV
jgi:predicted kinase